MTYQFQFESNGEDITVEVRNQDERGAFRDLVFLDHDVNYDLAFIAMGGPPSTAYLLQYLWYDEDVAAEANSVCSDNSEFMYKQRGWVRLNDTMARVVLSFCLSSEGRAPIAIYGSDFTIEQRLAMLQPMFQVSVASFLRHYNGSDLRPEQRLDLESRLSPEQKGFMAISEGHYDIHMNAGECLRIILESTDTRKWNMFFINAAHMNRKMSRTILDSMTDEGYITKILVNLSNLTATDIVEYAERLQSPELRREVGLEARNLSPEQRRQLIGDEP